MNDKVEPFLKTKFDGNACTFQRDNCPINTSRESSAELNRLFLMFLSGPHDLLTLNIMENIWKMLSDIVYDDKQYTNSDSLWDSVLAASEVIMNSKKDQISNLYNSMPRRCLKVIINKGDVINY